MLKVRRAIISVWEKRGIADFARKLKEFNVEIISTGKTALLLRRHKIAVREVSSLTAFPEILSGRVKTLHPKVFGGILANKRHPLHLEEIAALGIQPIDMVIVNLYPFIQKSREKLALSQILEYIDIGGPSLLRAGAKNFKNVVAVSSPAQYGEVIAELKSNQGAVSEELLQKLAEKAFYLTKEYDNAIYNYFKGREAISWNLIEKRRLRYGENPHQKGVLYKKIRAKDLDFKQHQGKEPSYNNFLDIDTAFNQVKEFKEPAAVLVKHASICGAAVNKKLSLAYKKAYHSDEVSSFGAIVALNRKVDKETAGQILKSGFKECIIAPSYSKETLRKFALKKNMIVLEADISSSFDYQDIKGTSFGYLVQKKGKIDFDKQNFQIVTKKKPTAKQMKDLIFAWKVAKYVKSNAIVAACNGAVLGVGGGQPSRVGAVKIALSKIGKPAGQAVLASDGFFPYPDSIKIAHRHKIKAVIQPGGSIKDKEVIETCNRLGIAMVFTGVRHFRH